MPNDDLFRESDQIETIHALEDYGSAINYPPIPDIASTVRVRLARSIKEPGVSSLLLHDTEAEKAATVTPPVSLGGRAPTTALTHPTRQWFRQTARLLAATATFAVVALLLFLAFDILSPRSNQPEPSSADAPTSSSNLLYVMAADGTITAIDTSDESVVFSIPTNSGAELGDVDPDAAISPDGRILYVIAVDSLFAIDVSSRAELWRIPLPRTERLRYIGGLGPSTLAVSPDGRNLYLYSSTAPELYYVRIFDAQTGAFVAETSAINQRCAADMHISPDGNTLYAVCVRFGTVAMVDLNTLEVLPGELTGSGSIAGAVESPDGNLYIIVSGDSTYRVVIIRMDERYVEQEVQLGGPPLPAVLQQLIALSPDGRTLYVTLGENDRDSDASSQTTQQVVGFDTNTWVQTSELFIDLDLDDRGSGLFVDAAGQLYGISNSFHSVEPMQHTSFVWMADPITEDAQLIMEQSSWDGTTNMQRLISTHN